MRTDVIIMVLIYEVLVVIGIGVLLIIRDRKKNTGDSFAVAGRSMGFGLLVPTMTLTALGNPHIVGLFEMSYGMGAVALWFAFANTVHFVILCLCTGPWLRKMKVATGGEALDNLYGKKVGLGISCAMSGVTFGVLTVECQGVGIIINALTGWDLSIAIVVGGVFGMLYVLLAGMKQVGSVNMINLGILYIGIVAATICIAMTLGGGFDSVRAYYESDVTTRFMTNVFGTPSLWFSFALANIISVAFYGPISQANTQAPMSAKNTKMIRRALWIVAPINGLFGVFSVMLGLTARSIPEYAELGATSAAITMLVDRLPNWVCALLLASCMAACLSSFAMTSLGCGTMFGYDIFKGLYKPDATDKQVTLVIRIVVVVVCVAAISIAVGISSIIGAMNWVFAWIVPVFWLFLFGLFWKRSSKVAGWTLGITWIVNCLWSLTGLPALFGTTADAVPNGYVTLVVGLVCCIIGNLIVKGQPGLWSKRAKALQRQSISNA